MLVKSANSVGKSYVTAALSLWFYATHNPALVIQTAPTQRQVVDVTFKETRHMWGSRPGLYPKAPRIQDHPKHLLTGFTATSAESFQGQREDNTFVVLEECIGVNEEIWTAAKGVLQGGNRVMMLAICNPTDSSSHAYIEELSGNWHVLSISAFEHPNIIAELTGEPPPIPAAVRLRSLKANMEDWGEWIAEATPHEDTDVDLWEPALYGLEAFDEVQAEAVQSYFPRRYWRPSPDGEARICGRYPHQSSTAIFTEASFLRAEQRHLEPVAGDQVVIGCDVARFGDDATSFHVRQGPVSLFHHTYRGQNLVYTAGYLKQLAKTWGPPANMKPEAVPILVDDGGLGGGVIDQRGDYYFIPVNSASTNVSDPEHYQNIRSELLFSLAGRLRQGQISLARIGTKPNQDIRMQAVGITYKLDGQGRRIAEKKDDMKKRLGRSPDDLDAVALAYYGYRGPQTLSANVLSPDTREMFGRRDPSAHGGLR